MSKQAKNHELVQIRPTTSWQTKFFKIISTWTQRVAKAGIAHLQCLWLFKCSRIFEGSGIKRPKNVSSLAVN